MAKRKYNKKKPAVLKEITVQPELFITYTYTNDKLLATVAAQEEHMVITHKISKEELEQLASGEIEITTDGWKIKK